MKTFFWISISALAYILLTVLVWYPLMIFSLECDLFDTSVNAIFWSGILYAALVIGIFTLCWWFLLRNRASVWIASFLCFCGIIVYFYLFICPVNTGTLQGAELMNADAISRSVLEKIVEIALLAGLFCICRLLINRFSFWCFVAAFSVLNLLAAIQAIAAIANQHRCDDCETVSVNDVDLTKEGIKLSTVHNNVFVFLLDMVQGASFRNIFDDKSIASELDGFVWYSNCASVANMTIPSTLSIYGGYKYSPGEIGRLPGSIDDKCAQAMGELVNDTSSLGYDFSYYYRRANLEFKNKWMTSSPLFSQELLSRLLDQEICTIGKLKLDILRCFSLFRAAPLLLKKWIYHRGFWRFCDEPDGCVSFGQEHSFCRALPILSVAHSGGRGNVNFFHTDITHNPWGVPENGHLEKCDNVKILSWTMRQLCAYFKWMKANGVYDNTRIIICSDHGLCNMKNDDFNPDTDPMLHRELWEQLISGVKDSSWLEEQRIQSLNALLCVKDFGVRSSIRESKKLISNGDIRELVTCDNVQSSVGNMPSTRRAYICEPPKDGSWFHGEQNHNLNALVGFEIRDNIYDLRNWVRIPTLDSIGK